MISLTGLFGTFVRRKVESLASDLARELERRGVNLAELGRRFSREGARLLSVEVIRTGIITPVIILLPSKLYPPLIVMAILVLAIVRKKNNSN